MFIPGAGVDTPVHLVCRDMNKPGNTESHCLVKKRLRSDHIGFHENPRIVDRTVNVAFCCEVDDGVVTGECLSHSVSVTNVALHKAKTWGVRYALKVRQGSGIRERIKHCDVSVLESG